MQQPPHRATGRSHRIDAAAENGCLHWSHPPSARAAAAQRRTDPDEVDRTTGDTDGLAVAAVVKRRLIDLVKTLPKPDHRQAYRVGSARVGVCFLDLGTTNSHIVRESESLHMIDRNFLSRTLNLDVSLSLLTHDQYRTASSYSLIRRRPNREVIPPTAMSKQPNLVWVPITHTDRLPRPISTWLTRRANECRC